MVEHGDKVPDVLIKPGSRRAEPSAHDLDSVEDVSRLQITMGSTDDGPGDDLALTELAVGGRAPSGGHDGVDVPGKEHKCIR